MKNLEKQQQEIFERQIELLIQYKLMNKKKTVYLNEKCLNDAISWLNKLNYKLT